MRGNKILRFFDIYLGIPLVYTLSVFRKKRQIPSHIKSVLLIRTAAIGDTVLMSASIQAIKLKYSDCKVVLLCGKSNVGISSHLKGLDEVILIKSLKLTSLFRTLSSTEKFDIAINFGQWPRFDALVTFFSNSRVKMGFNTVGQHSHYLYDVAVPHNENCHEIENFTSLIAPLGIETTGLPNIQIPISIKKELPSLAPYIIFHPWAAGLNNELKEWSFENWKNLASKLVKELNIEIFVSGAPADVEQTNNLVRYINLPQVRSIAGEFTLAEMIYVLNNAQLLVSVNTGIMHIACALNMPLISLNGPTSTLRWGAWSKKAINIDSKSDKCGYLNLGFEYHLHSVNCMEMLKFEDVFISASTLLKTSISKSNTQI